MTAIDLDEEGRVDYLLALPPEILGHVLSFLTLGPVLRFSECGRVPDAAASHDEIWKPLFEERLWLTAASHVDHRSTIAPGGWRKAYRQTARLESPLVLQFSTFRCLVGFARDSRPVPSVPRRLYDEAGAETAVDEALRAVGLAGTRPLLGADVVVVASVLDREADLEPALRVLFTRGAARLRLVDEACSALRHAGQPTGTVLLFGLESVTAACVLEGERLPLSRQRTQPLASLRHAVEYLAATARELPAGALSCSTGMGDDEEALEEEETLRRLAARNRAGGSAAVSSSTSSSSSTSTSASSASAAAAAAAAAAAIETMAGVGTTTAGGGTAGASSSSSTSSSSSVAAPAIGQPSRAAATRRRGADLAWLLREHCYVRAVGVERRPVSVNESEMSSPCH